MAHTEQIMVHGVLTDVTMFDSTAQEIDDAAGWYKSDDRAAAIGAAPAGYGLGSAGSIVTDYNEAVLSGWYTGLAAANAPSGYGQYAGYGQLLVIRGNNNVVVQHYYQYLPSQSVPYARMAVRVSSDGGATWQPWEYINPPLALGVEYRTTERCQSKPVYMKLVNFGTFPDATTKTVEHGAENVLYIVSGSVINSTTGAFITNAGYITNFEVTKTAITITTSGNQSSASAFAAIKYTKTTD